MKIAVYVPQTHQNSKDRLEILIVKTLFFLIRQHPEHTFIIVSNQKRQDTNNFLVNSEIVTIKSPPQNPVLRKLWGNVQIKGILKKTRADVLVMFENNIPLTTPVPKCVMVSEIKKNRPSNINTAQSLVVLSKSIKKDLIKKHQVSPEKVFILSPYPEKFLIPLETEKKEILKSEYSEGREFFIYNSIFDRKEDFVSLLKSFSHFKKRQQSGFKLLLLTQSNSYFEKTLSSYKYRNDVKFIHAENSNEEAIITAAAYAVILPFNTNQDMFAALIAMQTGVPVIATVDSIVSEIADNAAAYAESVTAKDIGDKMISVYTNESYRSELINRGITIAATYTHERTADILWQSIMKALE